jgi:hypothetical protein
VRFDEGGLQGIEIALISGRHGLFTAKQLHLRLRALLDGFRSKLLYIKGTQQGKQAEDTRRKRAIGKPCVIP